MKGSSKARSRGVTIVDLLMVVLIVCFLSGVVFSSVLGRARETQNRVNCAANLKMIGLAIQLYSNENKGMYPRTVYKPDQDVTQYTGIDSKDPFDKGPHRSSMTSLRRCICCSGRRTSPPKNSSVPRPMTSQWTFPKEKTLCFSATSSPSKT